ncbi:tetratricopeptide repeat domain 3 [Phyllostomus discolor]|uniref:Tetratricopeptide repeat domain 3 n=1 Tax=Phyllostomus discolor TaxID=89673 RepID=A0A834B2Z6_9CHIR|nr:tetratricopeptide repeat domain 3 [Phyllostomus discolor]
MKMKGNEEFSKERFDVAIVYYSRAIEYSPDNHLFYGNRALCFLRTRQFRNALGDGKRAIILKNNWTKVGFSCVSPWQVMPYSSTGNVLRSQVVRLYLEMLDRMCRVRERDRDSSVPRSGRRRSAAVRLRVPEGSRLPVGILTLGAPSPLRYQHLHTAAGVKT